MRADLSTTTVQIVTLSDLTYAEVLVLRRGLEHGQGNEEVRP